MNENNNLPFEQEPTEENIPKSVNTESVAEDVATDTEITEFFADEGTTENIDETPSKYYPPQIDIPVYTEADPINKKGIKVFVAVLSVAVLLSIFTGIGYFIGSSGSPAPTKKPSNINLAERPADADMQTPAQVYEAVDKSVVGVTAFNSKNMISGSGVVYSKEGYIIINDSLFADVSAAKFMVYDNEGNEYPAEFVAGDSRTDLAVIRITEKVNLTPAVFGDSSDLYFGEPIVAISRPTGATTANNITTGNISVPEIRQSLSSSYSMKYIQLDAALNPGSNGGAISNMYGQVVGIICTKVATSGYEGMGYAIPTTTVKKVVDSLIQNGYVENRARMGISYTEITSVQAEAQDIEKGLYVAEVSKDSDAYEKIIVGDVITAVNGTKITTADILLDVIENSLPGDTLKLSVTHTDGSVEDFDVKLLPDKGSSSYSIYENELDNSTSSSTQNSSEFTFPYGD